MHAAFNVLFSGRPAGVARFFRGDEGEYIYEWTRPDDVTEQAAFGTITRCIDELMRRVNEHYASIH